MGLRVLELQTFRERLQKRRVRLLPMLQWVSSNVWKASRGCGASHRIGSPCKSSPDSQAPGIVLSALGELARVLPTERWRWIFPLRCVGSTRLCMSPIPVPSTCRSIRPHLRCFHAYFSSPTRHIPRRSHQNNVQPAYLTVCLWQQRLRRRDNGRRVLMPRSARPRTRHSPLNEGVSADRGCSVALTTAVLVAVTSAART